MTEEFGFIPEFSRFICEHIPTNYAWAEANATALLATALGPGKYILSPRKKLYCNTFDLMIGPSGLANKSVVPWGFTYPALIGLSEEVGVDLIIPTRYSIEGMIEWLAKHSSHGMYLKDEFTSVFKDTGKSYLADNLEFLSELYDGMIQKRFTKGYKLEQTHTVYVPIVAATTPYFYKLMRPDFFVQGTGNRARFTIFNVDEDTGDGEKQWDFSKAMEIRKSSKMEEFIEILKKYYECSFNCVVPDLGVIEKVWKPYSEKIEEEAKELYKHNPFDLHYSYIIRSPERALKYSTLRRFSLTIQSLERKGEEIPIMEEDMRWAIKREEESTKAFDTMLHEWALWGKMQEQVTSQRDVIWQMCAVLAQAPNKMLASEQWRDLQDIVGVNRFYDCLRKAKVREWIKKVNHSKITDGVERERLGLDESPHTIVYTVTEKWFKGT